MTRSSPCSPTAPRAGARPTPSRAGSPRSESTRGRPPTPRRTGPARFQAPTRPGGTQRLDGAIRGPCRASAAVVLSPAATFRSCPRPGAVCRPPPALQCAQPRSRPQRAPMTLCFIEPKDAIRVIAESVGREARRQLLGEVVRAWVDEIPEQELESHYAKTIADLDEHDLSMLAAWHASLEVGNPIANVEFLINTFSSLGDNRREALKIAAGFRGEEAFEAGVAEEQAMETVLPWLTRERAIELAAECRRPSVPQASSTTRSSPLTAVRSPSCARAHATSCAMRPERGSCRRSS